MSGPYKQARYFPVGDCAVLVELGNTIDLAVNMRVHALNVLLSQANLLGVKECVPTYRSLLVYYDSAKTSYDRVVFQIRNIEQQLQPGTAHFRREGKLVMVPIVYGGDYGPDLSYVAELHSLSEEEVVRLHSEREYTVYMIGFIAGFPYLGEVPDAIATPRLKTPRLRVPAGSVGIAEKQTGIYPAESPGGWQIIGRTPLRLFNPYASQPALLEPGDKVKFKSITSQQFAMYASSDTAKQDHVSESRGVKVFEVVKQGLFTTVQDAGRCGFQRYGVSVSGAMDRFAFEIANMLVGNARSAACLEATVIGPELKALCDTAAAVTGADFPIKVNGQDAPMWQTLQLRRGDVLSLGKAQAGCRAYISVQGGVDAPLVMASRATDIRGGFGGLNGRHLKQGDIIFSSQHATPPKAALTVPEELIPRYDGAVLAHAVLGPQHDMFTEESVEAFFSGSYAVTAESDRVGYRLQGPPLTHRDAAEIVSDAVVVGAVQVPGSGQPIVVMVDAPTTGGYPKIAVITTPSLSALAQASPGDTVAFEKVSLSQAIMELREYEKQLVAVEKSLIRHP